MNTNSEIRARGLIAAATRLLNAEGVLGYSGHVSARIGGDDGILIQPFQTSRSALAPENLIPCDMAGAPLDPACDLQVLEKTWSSRLDPMAESSDRAYNSRVVIDACIPFERREDFPKVAQTSRGLAAEVRAKFPGVFG